MSLVDCGWMSIASPAPDQIGTVGARGRLTLRFGSRILLPVLVATAVAIVLAAAGLYQATARSDAIAVERQLRETQQAISTSLDELAINQQSVAIWDDALLHLRRSQTDWKWLDDNIGVWLHDLF